MRKVSDLLGIKRTPQEALKIGRILNRFFQFQEGYEEHHYRWCYKNLAYKNEKRAEFIKAYLNEHNIDERLRTCSFKFIDYVPLNKIEAKQSIVGWERVNHKIMGDDDHKQKDPEIDVTYPIVVYNKKEDLYYIWDGNNRVNAALILGEEEIKCHIVYP